MSKNDSTRASCPQAALASIILLAMTPAMVFAAPAHNTSAPEVTAKPAAPISIGFGFAGTPQIGQPLDVTLSVSVERDMSGGSLSVTADDPLAVIYPIDTVALGDISVGETVDIGVTVLPLVVQTHFMNVTVSGTIDGLEQTRSINIPVRLEDVSLRKAENEGAGKSTERVRSFGAIETVR